MTLDNNELMSLFTQLDNLNRDYVNASNVILEQIQKIDKGLPKRRLNCRADARISQALKAKLQSMAYSQNLGEATIIRYLLRKAIGWEKFK